MTRLAPLFVLLLFLPAAIVLAGDPPQVSQPNTTAYSAPEIITLTRAMATLAEALNDYNMASRRDFSAGDWSSRNFAMYTAGILFGKGYETLLVSGESWPDGAHTWVLVGIPLGTKTAWIPVEASPDQGHSQQILGYIPSTTDVAGSMWFNEKYLAFSDVVQLPPNIVPIAKIRKPVSALVEDQSSRLLAMTSVDPDGEIVLYKWDFGDGISETTVIWTVLHVFKKPGDYTVHLTVIGSRGATASTSLAIRVLSTAEAKAPSGGGCGCGK